MDDFDGFNLLGAAGSGVAFGPMTEAEAKAAAKPVMTLEPENVWRNPSSWFKDPAWKGGPPRWQIALGGVAGVLGLGVLGYAFTGGKK